MGANLCADLLKFNLLKKFLSRYVSIADIEIQYDPNRDRDILHSLANIEKATKLMGCIPQFKPEARIKETVKWHIEEFKLAG
ncbi:hypothetical protein D3C86_1591960 [compost metagenome]